MMDVLARDEDQIKEEIIEHIISKEQIYQRMTVLTKENKKLKEQLKMANQHNDTGRKEYEMLQSEKSKNEK